MTIRYKTRRNLVARTYPWMARLVESGDFDAFLAWSRSAIDLPSSSPDPSFHHPRSRPSHFE